MLNGNSSLSTAKKAKNDEFYTQYSDIEAEMNAYVEFNPDVFRDKVILLPCDDPEWSNFTKYFAANFERFGLKKLISTSYAHSATNKQVTEFEKASPLFDMTLHETHGKLFTLTRDDNGDGHIDGDDVRFDRYLDGDGDFRSAEITALRDEADIIITNPPFSLFRGFLAWIMAGNKQFIIIGNMNAITYKEVFPLLQNNSVWLGYKSLNNDMYFDVTDEYKAWLLANKKEGSAYKIINGVVMGRLASACWFTNLDHGKRHEDLQLMTMSQNLKYNKKLRKKLESSYGKLEYPHYDNYDAIEVPFTECIPSDYEPGYLVPVKYRSQLEAAGFVLGHECENSHGEMCVCVCVCGRNHDIGDDTYSRDGVVQRDNGRTDNVYGQVQSVTVRDNELSRTGDLYCGNTIGENRLQVSSDYSERQIMSKDISSVICTQEDFEYCSGVMGVPITFMDKYNPEQFEIVGLDRYTVPKRFLVGGRVAIDGRSMYARVLICR